MKFLGLGALICAAFVGSSAWAQTGVGVLTLLGQLRAADIRPEEGFSGVVGAGFLPDGSIIVGDAGRRSLHLFTSAGRYVKSVGRSGKGPGEFEELRWLIACADGSVSTYDSSIDRISVFTPLGTYVKAFATPAWYLFDTVLSCEDAEDVVILQDHPRSKPLERGKSTRFPAVVARANWTRPLFDTVRALRGTEFFFAKVRGYADLPLGTRAMAASSRGRIATGESSDTMVLVYEKNSRHIDSLYLRGGRAKTTSMDWEKARRNRIELEHEASTRKQFKTVLEEADPPAFLPVFDALLVDKYSTAVWARRFSQSDLSAWVRLGRVASNRHAFMLPTNVQVMDVSASMLLGLRRNDDGTEDLLLYKFRR